MAWKVMSIGLRRSRQPEGVDILEVIREATTKYLFDCRHALGRTWKRNGLRLYDHL
jgi:hypothetical protein